MRFVLAERGRVRRLTPQGREVVGRDPLSFGRNLEGIARGEVVVAPKRRRKVKRMKKKPSMRAMQISAGRAKSTVRKLIEVVLASGSNASRREALSEVVGRKLIEDVIANGA